MSKEKYRLPWSVVWDKFKKRYRMVDCNGQNIFEGGLQRAVACVNAFEGKDPKKCRVVEQEAEVAQFQTLMDVNKEIQSKNAALKVQLAQAREGLKEIEWESSGFDDFGKARNDLCMLCNASKKASRKKHRKDCLIGQALTALDKPENGMLLNEEDRKFLLSFVWGNGCTGEPCKTCKQRDSCEILKARNILLEEGK